MQLWDVTNYTPFAAFGGFERDHEAHAHWCLWIKAAFSVNEAGQVVWRKEPATQISPGPTETETGIMLCDGDMSLPKPATDICLAGTALAPGDGSQPFLISAEVGDWSKRLQVHTDRLWRRMRGVRPSETAPSRELPLTWHHAFGGMQQLDDGVEEAFPDNPIGTGFTGKNTRPDELALPRLTYPDEDVTRPGVQIRPASFLPIPRNWPARATLAGTFDDAWMKLRAPLLPTDHDPAWRHSAPLDQRYPGFLQGGEPVRLTNILWRDGSFAAPEFRLPKLAFRVDLRFDGAWQSVPMHVQDLMLWPDEGYFTLLWMGSLPIGAAANDVKVQETVVRLSGSEGFTVRPEDLDAFHVRDITDEEDESELEDEDADANISDPAAEEHADAGND